MILVLAAVGGLASALQAEGPTTRQALAEATRQGNALLKEGKYQEAARSCERALELAEKLYGPDHLQTATSALNLGWVCYLRGQYDRAESLYQRSLAIRKEKLGDGHVAVGSNLNKLALLYRRTGQREKAEPLFQRSLQIFEDKLGKSHPDVATILNNLAELYVEMSQYGRAEPLFLRSLDIRAEKLGKEHVSVAASLTSLAELYRSMGKYAKAEPLFQRSLQIREEKLGQDHPDVASTLWGLAALYGSMGQLAKAEPLYLRSLKIREEKLGKNDPRVAITLNNLALLYMDMGQYAKAEQLLQRSLQIQEDRRGKDHPDVAASVNNLALLYWNMGQYAKAEPFYQRALRLCEARRGKDHPNVAICLSNLADLYRSMGQYARAEPLYQRALKIREEKLGKDHPATASSLFSLGALAASMRQYAKAEQLYRRSLQIREEKLGKDHPSVATSLNNLALLYWYRGEYDRAEPLHQRSLEIREEKLGKDHPYVATSLNNLALLYWSMGQYDRAEPLYRRAHRIAEERLGKDHPRRAVGLSNLAVLHAAQEHWQEAGNEFEQARHIVHHHVQRILPALSEAEQLAFLRTENEPSFHRALSLALLQGKDDAALRSRSAAWLCNGKALGQQSLAERALMARDARGPHAAEARRLLEVRRQLAALSLASPAPGQEQPHRQQLQKLAQQEQLLARQLAQARGESQPDRPWLTPEQLRQAIPEDAVFIDVARFGVYDFRATQKQRKWRPAHYAAWIIPPAGKGEVQLIDLGEAAAIEQKVQAVRQALEQAPARIPQQGEPDSEKELGKLLRELAALVLTPLEPHIAGKKQWLLSPDGTLWLVPWAALPLADGSYAIEKHSLRYLVSGRDLVRPAAASKERPGAAQLFADPAFDLVPAQTAASTRGLADLVPELSGQTLKGFISGRGFTFQLRGDGQLIIRDADSSKLAGQGSWQQQGSKLVMRTKVSRFEGRIQGQAIIGTRHKQQDDGSASSDRWSASLPAEPDVPESERGLWTIPSLSLPAVSALPGTAREAALVAPRLEKLTHARPVVHTGAEASEGLLKAVKGPPLLMVSTHGFFLPDQETRHADHPAPGDDEHRAVAAVSLPGERLSNPLLRCGLLLAGCNQRQKVGPGQEDGVLTGLEIVGLDLRGTELVVLSACETGLGQVRNGEGVAGLRQAFHLAGAQSVLATLWQIPDRETAQLMGRFFDELAQGKDRAEALRQAQLSLIKARRKRYDAAHPFFWAAFTLTGQ